MTLGFHRAGFRCISAVEKDPDAAQSHALNFSGASGGFGYANFRDVMTTSPAEAVQHAQGFFSGTENVVDVVIGGPPCQAFSRLGRAALWRIAGENGAHAYDERATMYHHFLAYVDALQPLAFVMENVREIGKFANVNVAEEIACTAERLGYDCRYSLLNAVWYGVPQLRERAFVIGIRKELGRAPQFPLITHRYQLPVGYSTARAGSGRIEFLEPYDHYVDHLKFSRTARDAVTLEEAFADLPPIRSHLKSLSATKKPRDPDDRTSYVEGANKFITEMRGWPGFRNMNGTFTGHIIRNTPRDYETFKRMPEGGMYPEALETAEAIFSERLAKIERQKGRRIPAQSEEWVALHRATVPPYKAGRYPNKFRKLWRHHPSRTLPAHIGKDSYSHIHFDSSQARGISLREAARIQSFPDAFRFAGSMNSRLKQIGNAVPPLLAYSIARKLRALLLRNT
jgi:DNA (cytosine-5)-methyltransferase 1